MTDSVLGSSPLEDTCYEVPLVGLVFNFERLVSTTHMGMVHQPPRLAYFWAQEAETRILALRYLDLAGGVEFVSPLIKHRYTNVERVH